MKILTNHPGQKNSDTWCSRTKYLGLSRYDIYSIVQHVIKLHFLKRDFDLVILGSGRADILYLIINTLLCFGRNKCLVIDCLWYKSDNSLYHFIKKCLFKIADVSVKSYIVWSSREIEAYSNAFNLPMSKFIFLPYHHTINDLDINVVDEGYLFSGGNFGRDYFTLIESVRGLAVKLLIASTRPEIFEGIDIPENVVVKGFSHQEYLEMMAKCTINIVALAPNLLHSGGQQTFLNSMYFGKPTIVLDPEGACDYIENGVDGFLINPGDVDQLRKTIVYLIENKEIAKRVGQNAKVKAANHSTELHFRNIVQLAGSFHS